MIKDFLPKTVWIVDVPERPDDLAKRWHNKYAKDALRETVERFHSHAKGFPRHFARDARQRYQHKPRNKYYVRAKARGIKIDGRRYYSTMDLVKTGRSRARMLSEAKITVSGTASGSSLKATMIVRFDFVGGTGRFRKKTKAALRNQQTVAQMRAELTRFTEDDIELLTKWFLDLFSNKLKHHRSGRKRTRIIRDDRNAA